MTVRFIDESKTMRVINDTTRVIVMPGGGRGDRGPSGGVYGAVLDITSFQYLGVTYAAQPNVLADQTDVFLAFFAALAAGPIKIGYIPTGVYWIRWIRKDLNTRILPDDCILFGDGEGKTIIRGMESTFLANTPELGTSTLLHYDSNTIIKDMTIDGRGDAIRALPGTTNRRNNLVEQKYIALTTDSGVENVYIHDIEVTGQYSNEVAGTVVSSNTTGVYQFTLAAGHIVESGDRIWIRNHAGATFSRTVDGVAVTWTGNGVYDVLSVDGNNIEVRLESTGDTVTVTVAGTAGTVDNTTKNGIEGFGLVCGHGHNVVFERIHAHNNEGTGVTANWRDRENTTEGYGFKFIDIHSHHNGWQGISSFGVSDLTGVRTVTYNCDRVGMNIEYSNGVVIDNPISYDNGIHGYRVLGDGDSITYNNPIYRNNGATDYVALYGALAGSYPNDPTVVAGARTDGTDFNISTAPWQRLGMNRVGSPVKVVINNPMGTAAPGKYNIRAKVHPTANMDNGSQSIVEINGGPLTWQPITGAGAEPDANQSVNLQAQTRYPQLKPVQRIPVPPLTDWTMQNTAALAAPSGAYTTGLTSTAGAATVINWTAHGFQTGTRVLLDGFATVGQAQINSTTPHVITRTGANTFTIPVASTSNGVGGRGIDYRAEVAGTTSTLARTITMSALAGSGYRYPLPVTQAIGMWQPRYKLILSAGWWTAGITTTLGAVTTTVNWTAHPFETGDRVVFEDMAGSDTINVNDHHGFIVTVVDANSFTIPIATTANTSGGRAGRIANIPTVDIGVKNASGVGDAANGRFYPSVYQQITVGDNYGWRQPDILATPRAAVPGTYQLAAMLRKSDGAIANHKIVVDYVGDWHALVQVTQTYSPLHDDTGVYAPPYISGRFYSPLRATGWQEEFDGGQATSGTIGKDGWVFGALTSTTVGTVAVATSEAEHPGMYLLSSSTTNPGSTLIRPSGGILYDPAKPFWLRMIARPNFADASTGYRFGMAYGPSTTSGANNAPSDGFYFEKLPADANIMAVSRKAGVENRQSTGIADAVAWRVGSILQEVAGTVVFKIAGATVTEANATYIPTQFLTPFFVIWNASAANKTLTVDFAEFFQWGLSR